MTTIQEIEAAILLLSPTDRTALCARLAELDAAEWDRQIEDDIAAGRLDWLAEEEAGAGR
ncbi:MAG: hypothetical protein K8T25_18410 [Planctomycetia bacterium]|nr:hypothetical protein [Planctomycetia bacterium]